MRLRCAQAEFLEKDGRAKNAGCASVAGPRLRKWHGTVSSQGKRKIICKGKPRSLRTERGFSIYRAQRGQNASGGKILRKTNKTALRRHTIYRTCEKSRKRCNRCSGAEGTFSGYPKNSMRLHPGASSFFRYPPGEPRKKEE